MMQFLKLLPKMDAKFKENFAKLLYDLRVKANQDRGAVDGKPISYNAMWQLMHSHVGVTFNYNSLRTWEKQESSPKLENLEQIADYMGVSFVDLYCQLAEIKKSEEITSDRIRKIFSDWEEEEKLELVKDLFKDIIPHLSSEQKLEMMGLLAK